jgi:hypothetical protein
VVEGAMRVRRESSRGGSPLALTPEWSCTATPTAHLDGIRSGSGLLIRPRDGSRRIELRGSIGFRYRMTTGEVSGSPLCRAEQRESIGNPSLSAAG